MRIHVPFCRPGDVPLPVKVTIPAERIVFVEELPATDRPKTVPFARR